MRMQRVSLAGPLAIAGLAAALGFWAGNAVDRSRAEEKGDGKNAAAPAKTYKSTDAGDGYLRQSPAAVAVGREEHDYGLGDCAASKLKSYPPAKCGDPTPLDLYRYAGRGASSWSPPTLDVSWDQWVQHCRELKPKVMAACREYMAKCYDFNGKAISGAKMSGGKPIMAGPVA